VISRAGRPCAIGWPHEIPFEEISWGNSSVSEKGDYDRAGGNPAVISIDWKQQIRVLFITHIQIILHVPSIPIPKSLFRVFSNALSRNVLGYFVNMSSTVLTCSSFSEPRRSKSVYRVTCTNSFGICRSKAFIAASEKLDEKYVNLSDVRTGGATKNKRWEINLQEAGTPLR